MPTLTITQTSALADLRRFGFLDLPVPTLAHPRGRVRRGTPTGFGRQTLATLVAQGHAVWADDAKTTIVLPPVPAKPITEPIAFETGYLDIAFRDLDGVVERAQRHLADVDFDTLVGTGFSGSLVIPVLAAALGKRFVLIRKPADDSHHSGRMVGMLGARWLFVDDFVSTGATRRRVGAAVQEALTEKSLISEYVGDYSYARYSNDGSENGYFDTEYAGWIRSGAAGWEE